MKNPPPDAYGQAHGGGLLSFRYYSVETLHLGDNAYFCCFKELDDAAYCISVRHLLLNLVDCVQDGSLTVEEKAVSVGNMGDYFVSSAGCFQQFLVDASVLHRVVGGNNERWNVTADTHTAGDHRAAADAHVRVDDYA